MGSNYLTREDMRSARGYHLDGTIRMIRLRSNGDSDSPKHLRDSQDGLQNMVFRARKRGERPEAREMWGFLQSNVESRTEVGSCIRVIYYPIGTYQILAHIVFFTQRLSNEKNWLHDEKILSSRHSGPLKMIIILTLHIKVQP
jgi:hypothetical protein